MTSWLRTRLRPLGVASLDAVAPWSQRGRSRVVLGSRGERGAALGVALRVLAGGPLGALCRGKWPDAIMSLESEGFERARHELYRVGFSEGREAGLRPQGG